MCSSLSHLIEALNLSLKNTNSFYDDLRKLFDELDESINLNGKNSEILSNRSLKLVLIEKLNAYRNKKPFVSLVNLAHEIYRLNLYDLAESFLLLALNYFYYDLTKAELNAYKRVKFVALSLLVKCHWKQKNYLKSIDVMSLELKCLSNTFGAVKSKRIKQSTSSSFSSISKPSDDVNSSSSSSSFSQSSNSSAHDNFILLNKYRILGNLSFAYRFINNLSRALTFLCYQYDISIKLNNKQFTFNTLVNIAKVYMDLNDYNNAVEMLHNSISLIDELNLTQIVKSNKPERLGLYIKKLKLKQYNLLAECHSKLNNYEKSLEFLDKQLKIADSLINSEVTYKNSDEHHAIDIHIWLYFINGLLSISLNNLKLGNLDKSLEYLNMTLTNLNNYNEFNFECLPQKHQIFVLFSKTYSELINIYLKSKDYSLSAFYAFSMLELALRELETIKSKKPESLAAIKCDTINKSAYSNLESEMQNSDANKERFSKFYRHLKLMELNACSKIAICYAKQDRIEDAIRLHDREALLASELKSVFHQIRAYSLMAQIYFDANEFSSAIDLFKRVLTIIQNELDSITQEDDHCLSQSAMKTNDEMINNEFLISDDINKTKHLSIVKRNNKLKQVIFYTLSNIGLCMKKMERYDEACMIYYEQYETSKYFDDLKYKADSLLNLANLHLEEIGLINANKESDLIDSDQVRFFDKLIKKRTSQYFLNKKYEQISLLNILNELFLTYVKLKDLNGQLFASQYLALYYHSLSLWKFAIKFYLYNANQSKLLEKNDLLARSLNGLSICYRMLNLYKESYETQIEYFKLITLDDIFTLNQFYKLYSLGTITELLCKLDQDSVESYKICINLHLKRLNLIKSTDTSFEFLNLTNLSSNHEENWTDIDDSKSIDLDDPLFTEEKKYFLMSNSLDIISKCHFKLGDFTDASKYNHIELKFHQKYRDKYLNNEKKVEEADAKICKINYNLGNLYLFKMESKMNDAYKHYIRAYKLASKLDDGLMQSSILGNMGLIKSKLGYFKKSSNLFKKQVHVLDKRLRKLGELKFIKSMRIFLSSPLDISNPILNANSDDADFYHSLVLNEHLRKLSELTSMNVDIVRAYFKIIELLDRENKWAKKKTKIYEKYYLRCKFLNENHLKILAQLVQSFEDKRVQGDHLELLELMKVTLKETFEMVFNEYDKCLKRMIKYNYETYQANNGRECLRLNKSIELTIKRLDLLAQSQTMSCISSVYSSEFFFNNLVDINFMLANLYSKSSDSLDKSVNYCKQLIELFRNNQHNFDTRNIHLYETLNLLCDITVFNLKEKNEYNLILSNTKKSYEQINSFDLDQAAEASNEIQSKIFHLKYDSLCRLSRVYEKFDYLDEALSILQMGVDYFLDKFHAQAKSSESTEQESTETSEVYLKTICLIQILEYLFFLNRKIAIIYVRNALINDETIAKIQDNWLSSLKHANLSLNFLNQLKEFIKPSLFRLRQASVYFLLGKCHYCLGNNEISLEMFANSLDLYESFDDHGDDKDLIIMKDKLILLELDVFRANDLFDSEKYDDEESNVDRLNRVDYLYEFIEESLIKLNKNQEALLVIERHRTKIHLKDFSLKLNELTKFEQIYELMNQQSIQILLYFHYLKISSTLYIWLIQSNSLKILTHQLKIEKPEEVLAKSCLDQNLYALLIKPFETTLSKAIVDQETSKIKPVMCMIYDESMCLLGVHKQSTHHTLLDAYEINVLFSIKYLFRGNVYEQKYFKNHSNFSSITYNELEVIEEKIRTTTRESHYTTNKNSRNGDNASLAKNFHQDLLCISINQANKVDIKSLNYRLNNLFSNQFAKAILIEFYSDDKINKMNSETGSSSFFKCHSKQFIDSILSKMKFKMSLQVICNIQLQFLMTI